MHCFILKINTPNSSYRQFEIHNFLQAQTHLNSAGTNLQLEIGMGDAVWSVVAAAAQEVGDLLC